MKADRDLADIPRILDGNISAFENIVGRWQKPLINLAFRFCRDRQKAEEMAQDAFIHIFRNPKKLEGRSTLSTWVFSISLNLSRSIPRRKSFPADSLEVLAQKWPPVNCCMLTWSDSNRKN